MTIATKEFDRPVVGTVTVDEILSRARPVWVGATCNNKEHFNRGIASADDMDYLTISINNVWGGRASNGASIQSYERIGYHNGSDCWLAGALSSGCPIYACCEDGWRKVTFQRAGERVSG